MLHIIKKWKFLIPFSTCVCVYEYVQIDFGLTGAEVWTADGPPEYACL